jgi:hypothetical protein
MEIVLIVIGAVIGAAATGGVQAWDAWRTRRLRRMVAARVILGDLFVTEQMLELVLERKAWPDRVDLDGQSILGGNSEPSSLRVFQRGSGLVLTTSTAACTELA